jgi:hypothetical protein
VGGLVVKRGYLVTLAWRDRAQSWQRALALLAILAVAASMLIVGAANPPSVLAATGSNTATFSVVITGSATAGTPFTVTVTAKDSRGRTVNSYPGGATLSGLAASPNGTTPTYGSLAVWDSGVSSTTVTATKSQTGARLTASHVIDGVTVNGQSAAFSVAPAGATAVAFADAANTFNGQPVDAEFDTPIASSLGTTYVPVKVIALDTFGNRVGGITVTMTSSPDSPTDSTDDLDGTKTGSTNDSAAFGTSPYGEAAFGTLSITKYGQYRLTATAGTLAGTSASFEIVADLVKCTGSSCKSTGASAGTNLQITYSSLTGVTTLSGVTLTTSFIGDATDAECTGSGFGELSEVRVQGGDVATAQPAFQLAMIIPKATLQNLNLTSRAADTYNLCLGATRLDDGTEGWTGRETVDGPLVTLTDPDDDGFFWGFVADCGTAGLDADDPCVSLKTKNAGQLQSVLGMTRNEFRALGFASSDLALVIEKPFPWDGKMGMS